MRIPATGHAIFGRNAFLGITPLAVSWCRQTVSSARRLEVIAGRKTLKYHSVKYMLSQTVRSEKKTSVKTPNCSPNQRCVIHCTETKK